jgi:hypothetical protein
MYLEDLLSGTQEVSRASDLKFTWLGKQEV